LRYVSTRGTAPTLDFTGVLLAGLARDGGLYVPEAWPSLSADRLRAMRGRSYVEVAVEVMTPFLGGAVEAGSFRHMVGEAYASFRHEAVTPLVQLDSDLWLMELFHGPTLAFKDVALQLVGRLFDHALARQGERVTIVGATSGDTGSAAIEACRDRAAIDIFMLHPKGRVSAIQRLQMTTVQADNVHNIAIDGTFDDCQDLVKAMFADTAFRDGLNLSAVNSINWARVMAQLVYYVYAAVQLGAPDRAVSFAVPSGNFGNVYAGYGASRMGLPIERLIVGSNQNDILVRFFEEGDMSMATVVPTLSPSMDIQVSSNFERLLFDLLDRDGAAVAEALTGFRASGRLAIGANRWRRAQALFAGHRVDDAGTLAEIRRVDQATGELVDPHTAIGIRAAIAKRNGGAAPMVALATAHPAKFPDAVERATGRRPALPAHLADLDRRAERLTTLPNDLAAVQAFVRGRARVSQS
jgi:threonine synthase